MKTVMSDKLMRDAVIKELDWDPKVTASAIGVTAKDGAISLSGHVASYSEKLAAVRAVERVYGVKAVADDLEVKILSSTERDDADIAAEIARQRSWSTLIPASVQAEVRHGNVTLRGQVEWAFQRSEAARLVRGLAGVRAVSNLITIKPSERPQAGDVRQHIEEAIERMADLDARSIWVTTTNGTAHLHGHVHSLAERRIAEHAAEACPGVTLVDNEIAVRP